MFVPLAFVAACLIVLATALATRRDHKSADSVWLAACLTVSCVGTNALGYTVMSWNGVRILYPWIDFAILIFVLRLFWLRPVVWKVALIFALLNKLIIHAVFWLSGAAWTPYDYVLCCNILFAEELIIVLAPGGISIGRRILHIAGGSTDPGWVRAARRRIEIETTNVSQATKDW